MGRVELPEVFLSRMKQILGEEYEAFLASYQEPRRFGLRVNTGKISVEEFCRIAPFHLTQIPWVPNGFYYEKDDDPARHPFYYAGLYYLQEPSAMTPAAVLQVTPGDRVLDLCAAPGGKATALGAKLCGEGLLVANDISASRAKALLKNLEIFGVTNSFVTNAAPVKLAEQFAESFDKILVDAPCSGEGMFRKDEASVKAWSPKKVEDCAKTQREITHQAVAMLRPGGQLLYSTCTFSGEENEQTVAALLQDFPELELLEIPWYDGFSHGLPELADGNPLLGRCVRIFPHRMGGEGHFLALLRRKGGAERECSMQTNEAGSKHEAEKRRTRVDERYSRRTGQKAGSASSRTVRAGREDEAALEEFLCGLPERFALSDLEIRSGQVYCTTHRELAGCGLPFLRNGLYFGELRKGRFEPSQSLAMALRAGEYRGALNFAADDPRVRKYLRGETIEPDKDTLPGESGWRLLCVEGYPLGWGKLSNGLLKNKYHPGWRLPG